MDLVEQDQTRCKELRNIDADIRLQRADLVADDSEERNMLNRLRAEHAKLYDELILLQTARTLTALASAMPGVPGSAAGIAELANSIDIANIEATIQGVKINIAISEEKIVGFQKNHGRLNRIQAENAERMKYLNCALP